MARRPSYTPKSVKYLQKEGWPIVVRAERWNQYARVMQDDLGFIDVYAFHPERGFLFVQVTSRGKIENRTKKIIEDCGQDARWLAVVKYNRIVVHGWDKRNNRWRVKEVDITDRILAEVPRNIGVFDE